MIQWLRLCAPSTAGPGSIPGQGTRSHMRRLKILRAATRTQGSQIHKQMHIFKKRHHPRRSSEEISSAAWRRSGYSEGFLGPEDAHRGS